MLYWSMSCPTDNEGFSRHAARSPYSQPKQQGPGHTQQGYSTRFVCRPACRCPE